MRDKKNPSDKFYVHVLSGYYVEMGEGRGEKERYMYMEQVITCKTV